MSDQVNFFTERVIIQAKAKGREALEQIAMQIVAEGQLGIVENDQVDTGFMVNSGYWSVGSQSTYDGIEKGGTKKNRAGHQVKRNAAPEVTVPPEYDGMVGFAAEYAIYQEHLMPFLYPAVLKVAATQGANVKVKPL